MGISDVPKCTFLRKPNGRCMIRSKFGLNPDPGRSFSAHPISEDIGVERLKLVSPVMATSGSLAPRGVMTA
jgi:hypothetical protein